MNRRQRRDADFKRGQRWDRNEANAGLTAALEPILYHRQYTEEQAAEIANLARMAWHRLTSGEGSIDDFDVVATAANQVRVRAEGIGALAFEVAERAQEALATMKDRYIRLNRLGPDAAALADVPPMLGLYFQILCLSNPQQMIAATRETQARIRNGVGVA